MRILRHYNIRADFFEINPQVESISEFVRIRDEKIKITTEATPSQVMWTIALVYDYDSIYFNVEEDERKELIAKDYLNEPRFFITNKRALNPVIEKYIYLQRDSERRYLDEWNLKMDDVSKSVKKWKTTPDNLDELLGIMKKQKELLLMKEDIEDRIARRADSEDLRGGGKLSLIESGKI